MTTEKSTKFHGKTYKELASWPKAILERFVLDLESMKYGQEPLSPSKPMKGLGKGVMELKKNGKPAYRLVYVIKSDAIHILHVFTKTSDGTDSKHEETIKARYKSIG